MNEKKYTALVADPPWAYRNHNTGGSFKSGSGNHYTTLTPEKVADMRIPEICADDSVLFLWATTPLLPEIFPVVNAWGFKYKTMLTWYKKDPSPRVKFRLGLGHYFRGMTEHCIVATRGDVKPFGCQSQNVIIEKPTKHSRKPEGFWSLIERALGDINPDKHLDMVPVGERDPKWGQSYNIVDTNPVPRIELFCRGEPRSRWDGWGNQCEGVRKVELDLF
jgi:N6-adenosine-specific RNA methylase IME4